MKRLCCLCLFVLCLSTVLSIYAAEKQGCSSDAVADNVILNCNNSKNDENTFTAGSAKSRQKPSAGKNVKIKEAD